MPACLLLVRGVGGKGACRARIVRSAWLSAAGMAGDEPMHRSLALVALRMLAFMAQAETGSPSATCSA